MMPCVCVCVCVCVKMNEVLRPTLRQTIQELTFKICFRLEKNIIERRFFEFKSSDSSHILLENFKCQSSLQQITRYI